MNAFSSAPVAILKPTWTETSSAGIFRRQFRLWNGGVQKRIQKLC
jgi:hypothetical protein